MEIILHAPAIPLRGLVPIPNNEQRIEIGRLISLNALEELDNGINDGKVILLIQKDPAIAEPKKRDFEQYGLLAERKAK